MKNKLRPFDLVTKHIWWVAPIIVVIPITLVTQDPLHPTAAYVGTTSIWNLIEKLLNLT